jgi:ABC-type antimicrobial peptide transport system permease subunit
MVRSRGAAGQLAEPVRRAVQSLDPDLPVFQVAAMTDVVSDQVAVNRASARVLTGFGALALLLAAIGIYGVMAAAVSARSREIGVRVALGAPRSHVIGIVLARSVAMAAVGIAAGIAGALASARLLDSLLYGVSATDPVTIAGVAAVLLAATVLASYVPVRRALAVDPAKVLQGD